MISLFQTESNIVIPLLDDGIGQEEEDEDLSILPQEPISIECELEKFRLQWHQELSNNQGAAAAAAAATEVVEDKRNGNQAEEDKQEPTIEEQVIQL